MVEHLESSGVLLDAGSLSWSALASAMPRFSMLSISGELPMIPMLFWSSRTCPYHPNGSSTPANVRISWNNLVKIFPASHRKSDWASVRRIKLP